MELEADIQRLKDDIRARHPTVGALFIKPRAHNVPATETGRIAPAP